MMSPEEIGIRDSGFGIRDSGFGDSPECHAATVLDSRLTNHRESQIPNPKSRVDRAESWNYDGVRRCQRLPEVTHPVDSTRPIRHHIKSRARSHCRKRAGKSYGPARQRPETETRLTSRQNDSLDRTAIRARTPCGVSRFPIDSPVLNRYFSEKSEDSVKERSMRSIVFRFLAPLVLIVCAAGLAHAQGSFFTSLSGTVVDSSGGVIPGADVKVKNTGTGAEFNAVSASDGGVTGPSLPGGTYSVTVSLMGFKTATLNEVTLNAAIPASVKVVLSVGTLEENVTVTGDSALVVQTQTPSIATNLTAAQITSLPLTSRNALDSLTSLPGFNPSGTARNSTVNGLPKSAINITLDGMNIQDNYLKTSDGYFARLTPTLDSVEEVTVTTAGNTADATGQGGVQIKFVTKSGTNNWIGTAYEYFRHAWLNANTSFNNRDLPPDPATGK